jgi:short-subunit dehydrogenase
LPAEVRHSRILVTGATGGLGNAIARALHDRGAELLLSGRRADVLEKLRSDLGGGTQIIEADLASHEEVARLATEAGPVDVLVANAGLGGTGRLAVFDAQEIDEVLDINLRAPIQLARAVVPGMVERGRGQVVLISSIAGKMPAPASSIYSATKFGLRGFGYSLDIELTGTGVGVTTVFPGFVRDAGLFAKSGAKLPPGVGTSSPQEVANAVVRGIEEGKVEIDVAPIVVRSSARLFGVAPSLVIGLGRRLGGARFASDFAQKQRERGS